MVSVAQFSAQARFVAGPHSVTELPWSKILPTNLAIDGRIPVDTTTKYLAAQRTSATKHLIAIQIDPADPSQRDMHRKLFQYFHDRHRYGVLQIQSNIVKDAYLIPLAKDAPMPAQIESMDRHEIPVKRTEQSLLAILVIHKNIPELAPKSPLQATLSRSKPVTISASPPNRDMQKQVSPAAGFSPPTAQTLTLAAQDTAAVEAMAGADLSAADMAALQGLFIAHPEILSNPQILTNPSILQTLIERHLRGQAGQAW